jgi:NAD(P)-dependent dehydrogenase (short-subunit alcohol dehydrogenase family)
MRFTDYKVVVTGAADGMGRASAEAFLAEGAKVLAVDLKEPEGDALECSHKLLDITEGNAPVEIMEAAKDELGGLDVLVNNAGICPLGTLEETDDDAWDRTLDVNLRAMFRLSRAALPLLKNSEAGRVLNIASICAQFSNAGTGAYTASKHGVAGLSKSLAAEWGPFGITVNYILPGAIVTGITREIREADTDFRAYWENKAPLGRWGQPEDVAKAMLFLASRDADFITGHGLAVDGGAMICS